VRVTRKSSPLAQRGHPHTLSLRPILSWQCIVTGFLMTFGDGGANENKYFDQPFCGKVVRIGAIACAATLAGNVLILLLVDPSHSRCAGWAIQGQNGGGSIWGLVAAVGLWAAWIGYWAARWDWSPGAMLTALSAERLAESDTGVGLTGALMNFRVRRARARVYYTRGMC
jgi:hypothetical protein